MSHIYYFLSQCQTTVEIFNDVTWQTTYVDVNVTPENVKLEVLKFVIGYKQTYFTLPKLLGVNI